MGLLESVPKFSPKYLSKKENITNILKFPPRVFLQKRKSAQSNYCFQILWAFSIYLEAVAILPQLYMIYKRGEVEKSLLYYLIPLGLYRLFYIFNWIYRYSTENHIDRIADTAGIVYVSIYLFALIEFCVLKIKVTNEENEKFLKSNIFFISNNEAYHEISNDEKSLSSEQPVEKV